MSGVQFWPVIALVHVDTGCDFGRTVGITEGGDEPCADPATAHGDLCGVGDNGQPEEVHLHLCARHYEWIQSGQTEVWVGIDDD